MKHTAKIIWKKAKEEPFTDNQYSRQHLWKFDGGTALVASSSPQVVPLPYSVENAVDPEEAFVAALSSCHMLFFLSIAASKGYVVEEYFDSPIGTMTKNEDGTMMMASVELQPEIKFAKNIMLTRSEIDMIHHLAHEKCFLAKSVKSNIIISPQY